MQPERHNPRSSKMGENVCVCVLHNSNSNKKRTYELNPLVANFWFQYSIIDFELTLQEAAFHTLWQKDFNLFQSPSKENVRMDIVSRRDRKDLLFRQELHVSQQITTQKKTPLDIKNSYNKIS